MQLADDCAFGPVDNKRALAGHQGQFAQKYGLFDHVLDRAVLDFLVAGHEAQSRPQRGGESHIPLAAFLFAVAGVANGVADVFERVYSMDISDRKNTLED